MIVSRGDRSVTARTSQAAGHIVGKNYSVPANLSSTESLASSLLLLENARRLVRRMFAALDRSGGGRRHSRQRPQPYRGTGKPTDKPGRIVIDLRVDDSADPLPNCDPARLRGLHHIIPALLRYH